MSVCHYVCLLFCLSVHREGFPHVTLSMMPWVDNRSPGIPSQDPGPAPGPHHAGIPVPTMGHVQTWSLLNSECRQAGSWHSTKMSSILKGTLGLLVEFMPRGLSTSHVFRSWNLNSTRRQSHQVRVGVEYLLFWLISQLTLRCHE